MFKTIVVGTDGSDSANKAVLRAAELARSSGATLHLVSAYHPVIGTLSAEAAMGAPPPNPEWEEEAVAETEKLLKAAADAAVPDRTLHERHVVAGEPAGAILDIAEKVGADLIVVGSKGMGGARRFLLGSVPNKVTHHASCDVLIVHTT